MRRAAMCEILCATASGLAFFGVFFHSFDGFLLAGFEDLALGFKTAARPEKLIGTLRTRFQMQGRDKISTLRHILFDVLYT